MKGVLNSGAKPAPGGARKGAGRKPDWFKAECARILDQHKLLEFMGRVASGQETETHIDAMRNVHEIPAKMSDRIKAVEFLADRAHGKPAQAVEVSGEGGGPLTVTVVSYQKA
jgi:hypothetical protein